MRRRPIGCAGTAGHSDHQPDRGAQVQLVILTISLIEVQ